MPASFSSITIILSLKLCLVPGLMSKLTTQGRGLERSQSQNGLGWKGSQGSAGPIPLLQQGHPRAHDCVQVVLEYLQ